jgi:hypothetical protein
LDFINLNILNNNVFETQILNMIEENLSPLYIIRLLCLYCITHNGLNQKFYKQFKIEFIKTYGYQYVFLLENLSTAKLIYFENDKDWNIIKNKLVLISNQENDIASIYNGYAPLSCRLVEYGLTVSLKHLYQKNQNNILLKGWGDVKVNKKVSVVGTPFQVIQNLNNEPILDVNNNFNYDIEQQLYKIVLICFVGPITYGEIAALRKLTQMNPGKKILILTTHLVNGNTFIKTFNKFI